MAVGSLPLDTLVPERHTPCVDLHGPSHRAYQPEKARKASAPIAMAFNAATEDCATVSGAASSPPRCLPSPSLAAPDAILQAMMQHDSTHPAGNMSDDVEFMEVNKVCVL